MHETIRAFMRHADPPIAADAAAGHPSAYLAGCGAGP